MKLNRTDILFKDELTLKYFNEIKEKVLTESEFLKLFNEYKGGNVDAFNSIIKANLRYVVSIAKKYQNNNISLNDLISAGNIGLIISLTKFDLSREVKFTVYSKFYIVREINIQIEEFTNRQKYDNAVISNSKKSKSLFDDSNCVNKIQTFSSNTPIMNSKGDSNGETYETMLVNEEASFDAENNFRFEAIYKAIDMLNSDEKEIIGYRFGINNTKPMTFEEISDIFVKSNSKKVTAECIRLKCNSIIQKLKIIAKTHETNLREEL